MRTLFPKAITNLFIFFILLNLEIYSYTYGGTFNKYSFIRTIDQWDKYTQIIWLKKHLLGAL